MDTKSKKYNIGAVLLAAISVVAAVAATIAVCALVLTYGLEGGYGVSGKLLDDMLSAQWMVAAPAIIIAIAAMIGAFIKTGVRDEKGEIIFNPFDRIFTDIQLAAGVLAGFVSSLCCVAQTDVFYRANWHQSLASLMPEAEYAHYASWSTSGFEPVWVEQLFATVGMVVLYGIIMAVLMSVVKKLKAGAFWRNTIIGRVFCGMLDAAKGSEGVLLKVMVGILGVSILSATWFGIIPVLILIFIFVPQYVRKYNEVKEGVTQVKSGNLSYKIPVTGNGELDRLAASINEISAATNIAVQNELKNQRLKTDLISNVSHDLKTPLTSMVSYVDLLKTEGLDSENAPEYLDIIDQKTRRLQKLTEDLFDAAKASSGAIPVELDKIEMASIVNQALGELEEKLVAANLDVIFTNKAEKVYVMADGQLLWRVIENLLVNVSKYALPGSRVYMDITDKAGMIILEVKNISKDPLNISADELMERFQRGDASRNTEGSGLGLAIAKDLTKLMNGVFEISIDGDLFKARVALSKAEAGQTETDAYPESDIDEEETL